MYNRFETLQSKCRRYYLKKYIKISLPIIFLSIVGLYFFQNEVKKGELIQKAEVTKPTPKKIKQDILVTPKPKIKEKNKVIVKKTKRVIKDVPYELKMYSYNLLNKKRDSSRRYSSIPPAQIVRQQPIKQQVTKAVTSDTPFSISVKKIDSLEDMISSYNKEEKYSLALKIAQYYFDNKNYIQSSLWSKRANKLNPKGSEAWILYAKNEYAKGDIQKAKDLLKMYVNSSNSKEAKELLISWIKGDK